MQMWKLSLAWYLIITANAYVTEISLNGDNWSLKESLGRLSHPVKATVPGQVHLDLMRANIIGDPYAGWNDWLYQWIAYDNWSYSSSFTVEAEDLFKGRRVYLKCDGLDTIANISVNDVQVGKADNYHRRFMFDITKAVKAGDNLIEVAFESAVNYSQAQNNGYPYDIFTGGDTLTANGESRYFNSSYAGFVRKVQSDFGWDWGIALVPCGIWGNISVVFRDMVDITDIVPKTYYDESQDAYFLSVTTCVTHIENNTAANLVLGVSVTVQDPHIVIDKTDIPLDMLRAGEENCHTVLSQPLPPSTIEDGGYLWWPLFVKWPATPDKPMLVKVSVHATVNSGPDSQMASAFVEKNVGFRRIDIVQEPVKNATGSPEGLTFYFQMSTSGQTYPFYAKGSNFIPMDALVNRPTKSSTRKLLNSFVMGNQNMLRVWGGGLYQPDWFYDLCDELGIMIWQEFMFADSLYPRDKYFLANVDAEVKDVVRRLGHHPSIVLWSGNNENQGIAAGNIVKTLDYSALYDGVVRTRLWKEDTSRIYWPSSPSNGYLVDDKDMGLFIQRWGDPHDLNYGDLHRYDYTSNCLDVSKFPSPRFTSEFGLQSYPSFFSMKDISNPVDWSNDSPFMQRRNHHPNGNSQMEKLIAMIFNLPVNDNSTYKFMDFIYLSQVLQAICIQAEAEHYRRLISTEGIFTRGTLYWQLNDIWQAPTWASVEYGGRWKILHYYMRHTYEPILVSAYQLNGYLVVYVVLDVINHEIEYTLQINIISWAGKYVNSIGTTAFKNTGFTGIVVYNETMDTVFKGTSTKESFLSLKLISQTATEILASSYFFPSSFTEVDLPDANVTTSDIKVADMGDNYTVTFALQTTATAPFVFLESANYIGMFSDNGFLLEQSFPIEMSFVTYDKGPVTAQSFEDGLLIRSLKDSYSNKPYK